LTFFIQTPMHREGVREAAIAKNADTIGGTLRTAGDRAHAQSDREPRVGEQREIRNV
jgi:hypothetical protein